MCLVVVVTTGTAIRCSQFMPEAVVDWGPDWLVAGPGLLAGLLTYRFVAPVCYRIWVRRSRGQHRAEAPNLSSK